MIDKDIHFASDQHSSDLSDTHSETAQKVHAFRE